MSVKRHPLIVNKDLFAIDHEIITCTLTCGKWQPRGPYWLQNQAIANFGYLKLWYATELHFFWKTDGLICAIFEYWDCSHRSPLLLSTRTGIYRKKAYAFHRPYWTKHTSKLPIGAQWITGWFLKAFDGARQISRRAQLLAVKIEPRTTTRSLTWDRGHGATWHNILLSDTPLNNYAFRSNRPPLNADPPSWRLETELAIYCSFWTQKWCRSERIKC